MGVELKHGDLILLGEQNLFIFNNPNEFDDEPYFAEGASYRPRITLSSLVKKTVSNSHGLNSVDKPDPRVAEYEALIKEQEQQIIEKKLIIEQLYEKIEANNAEMKKLKEIQEQEQVVKKEAELRANSILDTYEQIETSESKADDLVSREFDQQDEIHSIIEKFEVKAFCQLRLRLKLVEQVLVTRKI